MSSPKIFEYHPTYVKLPAGLTQEFSKNSIYDGQRENKMHDPNYDDYSLFYDVFFDINRRNIWTVGPPLFSLEKQFSSVKILYNGQPIRYAYTDHFPPHSYKRHMPESYDPRAGCAACFRIPAKNIKEENPTLTFVGKEYQFDVRVSSLPPIQHPPLVLSVLQKNYSVKHVVEWVLWHYTLYNARSILLYDNGSENIDAVKKALQNIKAPGLEITLIHWNYYYGGSSLKFNDLFAQRTQLHHSLRLHWQRGQYITNFDMDEFLVSSHRTQILKTLKKNKPYLNVPRYEIADTEDNEPCGIADCEIRERALMSVGKYIYYGKGIRYIEDPHRFLFQNNFSLYCNVLYKLNIIRNHLRACHIFRPECFYLIHTAPIKVVWKDDALAKKMGSKPTEKLKRIDLLWDKPKHVAHRSYRTAFDPNIHTVDRNVQNHLRDLCDTHEQEDIFRKSVSLKEISPGTMGYESTNTRIESWQRYAVFFYIARGIFLNLTRLIPNGKKVVRYANRLMRRYRPQQDQV